MRVTAVACAVVAVALTGCALLRPDYGSPPALCGIPAGAELAWSGQGDPADFGLTERRRGAPIPGDIYVEAEPLIREFGDGLPPDEALVCVISLGHPSGTEVYMSLVPDGWEPP